MSFRMIGETHLLSPSLFIQQTSFDTILVNLPSGAEFLSDKISLS